MRTPRREYGPGMLAAELGLSQRLMHRARCLGHVPEPDVEGGRWSRAAAEALEEVVAARLLKAEAAAEAETRARTRRPADSLSEAEAAEELGWSARRLQLFAARGGLTRGPDGRYDRTEVLARYAADPWRGESVG
ncbi:hypothetical protein [Streptomyces sp. CB01881]|uniref:hypothetical protein n=1 Tax=Streptomyces sp. CB01881 TaxID=2078691 RepID=UPI00129C4C2B|nr:hypothetical protein [Streptomyces sp. CB01881]